MAERAAGADDPRLAPLRMRERQLTTIADRRADGAAGRFVAEGDLVVERAIAAGVKEVVFDRGGYMFHGRVKALADAAREGGLSF